VTAASQIPLQAYDRIEIPAITPDVTRVTLHGGTWDCQEFRVQAMTMGRKEPSHGTPQSTDYP